MLGNMLNDLAEAIRRWTEKKAARLQQYRPPYGGWDGLTGQGR